MPVRKRKDRPPKLHCVVCELRFEDVQATGVKFFKIPGMKSEDPAGCNGTCTGCIQCCRICRACRITFRSNLEGSQDATKDIEDACHVISREQPGAVVTARGCTKQVNATEGRRVPCRLHQMTRVIGHEALTIPDSLVNGVASGALKGPINIADPGKPKDRAEHKKHLERLVNSTLWQELKRLVPVERLNPLLAHYRGHFCNLRNQGPCQAPGPGVNAPCQACRCFMALPAQDCEHTYGTPAVTLSTQHTLPPPPVTQAMVLVGGSSTQRAAFTSCTPGSLTANSCTKL